MTDLIYTKNGNFTSVRDPYMEDEFVANNYKTIDDGANASALFNVFLDSKPMLDLLLRELEREGGEAVRIVDCGVFMGIFTIAVSMKAAALAVPVDVFAYEANPALIEPIQANLKLYGVRAEVFANGIGGEYGTLEFVHTTHGLIGGSIADTKRRKSSAEGFVSSECQVVPLSAILADEMAPGIVKIDIEGYEVSAFKSIVHDKHRLNNVFIVEFAPFQAKSALLDTNYGEFLLSRFEIFDVNNWLWVPYVRRLLSMEQLEACLEIKSNRAFNTDLFLIPKSMKALIEVMNKMVAMK